MRVGDELKQLFHTTWGNSKIFPATDIRCSDFHHNDFTLRASNLKEAVAKVEGGNFVVCSQEHGMFTASGCPPTFPSATLGLVKAQQKGGTGGEEDWTTFHAQTPWKIVFEHENQSVTWNLIKKAQHSRVDNVRDGLNDARPFLDGTVRCGLYHPSPKQHLMRDPLKEGMKEKDRIRKATKDRKTYLLGDPHWKRKKEEENPKQDDDSGVETESSQEVSPTLKKVFIFIGHHLRLHLSTALYVLFVNTNQSCLFHSART